MLPMASLVRLRPECSPQVKRLIQIATDLLVAFFAGFLALQGWNYTIQKGATIITGINIPQGWMYISQPIGGVIMILFIIEHLLYLIKSRDGIIEGR